MSLPRPTQPVENLHTTLSTSQDLLVSKVTDDGDLLRVGFLFYCLLCNSSHLLLQSQENGHGLNKDGAGGGGESEDCACTRYKNL